MYTEVYNGIHLEKNYFSEVQQIISIIDKTSGNNSKILDFGCGTGKHARELKIKGFNVSGYDLSIHMIKLARINAGDIKFYDRFQSIPGKFDFTYSVFDVLSYQIEDSDIDIFLSNINSTVKSNGFVLLDGGTPLR
jgi:SAM-dependent methyltransferase